MISDIKAITADSVTVVDPIGQPHTIGVRLTPRRQYLTQATKRSILATGFLLRYGEELACDEYIINDVLEGIRQDVLALQDGNGQ